MGRIGRPGRGPLGFGESPGAYSGYRRVGSLRHGPLQGRAPSHASVAASPRDPDDHGGSMRYRRYLACEGLLFSGARLRSLRDVFWLPPFLAPARAVLVRTSPLGHFRLRGRDSRIRWPTAFPSIVFGTYARSARRNPPLQKRGQQRRPVRNVALS